MIRPTIAKKAILIANITTLKIFLEQNFLFGTFDRLYNQSLDSQLTKKEILMACINISKII